LANEIARQFEHKPPAEAATAIANHIKTVWDPRMKRALVDYVDAGAADLAPVAVLAANQVRATLK
jgi:formate dehydrogenase subunit delta